MKTYIKNFKNNHNLNSNWLSYYEKLSDNYPNYFVKVLNLTQNTIKMEYISGQPVGVYLARLNETEIRDTIEYLQIFNYIEKKILEIIDIILDHAKLDENKFFFHYDLHLDNFLYDHEIKTIKIIDINAFRFVNKEQFFKHLIRIPTTIMELNLHRSLIINYCSINNY